MKRTKLDDEFDEYIWWITERLTYFNMESIAQKQPDIKSASCYILEILDTIMSNRTD